MGLTLHRCVELSVLHSARTEAEHHEELGCSIQGPGSRAVRRAMAPLKRELSRLGREESLRRAGALVATLERSAAYDRLCSSRRRAGRRLLRAEVLFPDPHRLTPRFLHFRNGGLGLDVPIPAGGWPRAAELIAALAAGVTRRELSRLAGPGELGTAIQELLQAGWIAPASPPPDLTSADAVFVGHNTVLLQTGGARILVDPYFRPASVQDLPSYQPMQARDLGRVDAVVITHSHGDHFHLGSLLTLPRDTPVLVPHVARESLFSTDCALRLRQLGFTRAEALRWGETRTFGAATVRALPFYGEQPTSGEGVHGGLFNEGATWLVRGPERSAAFFADAGADVRGDMRTVCDEVRREGAVELLFCGIRGFKLRPLFFAATTLEPFLVDVPREALQVPQQLMADPFEALEYGARLGARYVVPCADGGAPWYWREGMGPPYPGYPGTPVPGAGGHEENPDADPYPERLIEAHRARPGTPAPLLLRPGEGLRWRGTRAPERLRFEGFTWPFPESHAGRSAQ